MRGLLGSRTPHPEQPRPFSSGWLEASSSAVPELAPPRRFRLPGWIPDGRALSAVLVVTVTLAIAAVPIRQGVFRPSDEVATATVVVATSAPTAAPIPLAPTAAPLAAEVVATEQIAPDPSLANDASVAAPEFVEAPKMPNSGTAAVAPAPVDKALLPEYRIVTFYGHPHDANMGIVGELSMEESANSLRIAAADYAAADPSRPVIAAFELITTVAQRVPGSDGTYILDTDHETLTAYIDYAEEQGMLVVLDLQIGRGTVVNEIEKVRDLLARPNVHLALDPEFAVAEGQIPGEYIGSVPAESIAYAQKTLAEISAQNGIPPKMLIVHQFREDMIRGKAQLAPYPGVQLVIDADGYGAPELKTAVYNFLVRDEPVEFAGVKLFYRQDVPLMSPQEILELVPPPDVIIYQ